MAEFAYSHWNPTTGYTVHLGAPPWTYLGSVKKHGTRWEARGLDSRLVSDLVEDPDGGRALPAARYFRTRHDAAKALQTLV